MGVPSLPPFEGFLWSIHPQSPLSLTLCQVILSALMKATTFVDFPAVKKSDFEGDYDSRRKHHLGERGKKHQASSYILVSSCTAYNKGDFDPASLLRSSCIPEREFREYWKGRVDVGGSLIKMRDTGSFAGHTSSLS